MLFPAALGLGLPLGIGLAAIGSGIGIGFLGKGAKRRNRAFLLHGILFDLSAILEMGWVSPPVNG